MTELQFLEGRYTFLESPRWHDADQSLYFCDIPHGRIYRLRDGAKTPEMILRVPDWVHGFALSPGGDLLINSARLRQVLRFKPGFRDALDFDVAADLFRFCHGFLNEIVIAPNGHMYVSAIDHLFTSGDDFLSEKKRSPVVHIAPDGKMEIATRMTHGPNGMVITPDGKTLYIADTFDACVYTFDIAADGKLNNGRVFAKWDDEMPDGMCADAEGAFWMASKHRVIRFREGGEILESIDVGDDHVIACMLGGPDHRTLFVETLRMGSILDMAQEPPTARIGFARVKAPGIGKPSQYIEAPARA